jgi:hypothetical protein
MKKVQALSILTSLFADSLINLSQYRTLTELIQTSEESGFFVDKVLEVHETVASIPALYAQDGAGGAAVVYLHYFKGGYDCWITELSRAEHLAFGVVSIGGHREFREYGYISMEELFDNGVELDLYWTPKPIGEVR